jgi:molecular chaperone GrpE
MQSSRESDGEGRAQGAAQATEEHEQAAQASEAAPGPDELGQLQDQFAQLEDRYKRALADLDNYRKRAGRETERRIQENRDALMRDWLEVVDSLERAVSVEPVNPVAEGYRAILEQMESILARHGVERVGAPGERFDPDRHEAIGVRETDEVPDRTILEVARSGYAQGDRMLRPAQVVVSRAPSGDG